MVVRMSFSSCCSVHVALGGILLLGSLGCAASEAPPARSAPSTQAIGASCLPCSGRRLQCSLADEGGPGIQHSAAVLGTDAAGCWGAGAPGMFAAGREKFWFRCQTQQFCVAREDQCVPATPTPTGFWAKVPGQGTWLCNAR